MNSVFQTYELRSVRDSAILTNAYVAGTVIADVENVNQLIILADFTKGSADSCELKIEFLNGSVYSQEIFALISGGVSTDTLGSHTFSESGVYNIPVEIKCSAVKISAKATGTVTGSLLGIDVVVAVT